MSTNTSSGGLRRPNVLTLLLLGLAAVLLTYLSSVVLRYYAGALVASGPNTIGEAGKVYFAQRFAEGRSIFETGLETPYYPSVHGALLHAIPGGFGFLLGADTTTYYYIGRALSVAFTVGTVFVATRILTALDMSRVWIVIPLLLMLAERHVFNHSVSYRPDNWVLFFSASCCLVILSGKQGWRSHALLTTLPVLAFYTKATALSLLGSVVIALIVLQRTREAMRVAGVSLLLLLSTGAVLQYASDGRFLEAFSSGAGVGFSMKRSVMFLVDPLLAFVVSLPILLSRYWSKKSRPASRPALTLRVFWAVGLFSSIVAVTRTGSNFYYFIEPYFYGSLLLAYWLHSTVLPASSSALRLTSSTAILAVSFVSFASHVGYSGKPDISLFETLLFADERQYAADIANASGSAIFSSDPGLNVLLNSPRVVHPSLQTELILGGVLSPETLLGPVEQCEYARIYLTKHGFQFHGVLGLPPEFFEAVERQYQLAPYDGDYLVYEPKQLSCLSGSQPPSTDST